MEAVADFVLNGDTMTSTTSYRPSPDAMPVNLTLSPFTALMLDDLKSLYGPGQSDILRAAIDTLYAAIGNGSAASSGDRLGEITSTFCIRPGQASEYALFWLWAQKRVGAKMFVVS